MLHVLNLLAVLLLPALTSSFPHSSRWKEMYERHRAGFPTAKDALGTSYVCCNQPPTPPGGRIPRPPFKRRHLGTLALENTDDRETPLRQALEELSRLQLQQQQTAESREQLQEEGEGPDSDIYLPPGGAGVLGFGGLYSRKREELMARLLGGRAPSVLLPAAPAVLRPLSLSPPAVPSSSGGARALELLRDAHKRGGFVGAPGSAGGPNMFGR
ncbi:uncharacterized protein LOC143297121 isoform X2 [Babylonia areolata]|uniref:uncharacterized protein LOC143297121 isoform X2 n=1 Tax=Babylonia areolata TaxID=304850 RepID=UPI003FD5CF40